MVVSVAYLMSDLNTELETLHVADASELNVKVWLEVSSVLIRSDKYGKLTSQRKDVLHLRARADVQGEALLHLLAAGDVLDPEVVGDVVWDLDDAIVVDALEDAIHQGDVLHD